MIGTNTTSIVDLEQSSAFLVNTSLELSSVDSWNSTANYSITTLPVRPCDWQLPVAEWVRLCFIFIGVFGNGLTFLVILWDKSLHNVSYLIICCIAIADFLFCLSGIMWSIFIVGYLDLSNFRNYQKHERCVSDTFYAFLNDVVRNLLYASFMSSSYFVVALSVFRFIAVSKPLKSKLILNKYVVALTVINIWMAPVIYSIWKDVSELDISDPISNIIHSPISYAIPLVFIILFHTLKIVALKRNKFRTTDTIVRRMEKNVAAVILSFFLLPLPWHIFRILSVTSVYKVGLLVQIIGGLLLQLNNCINPILYAFLSPLFRKKVAKMLMYPFRCICTCEKLALATAKKSTFYSITSGMTSSTTINNIESIRINM